MGSKTAVDDALAVSVVKRDLLEAWSVLEKLVVSLRKIGTAHAIKEGQANQTSNQRQMELEALDGFLSPELLRELSRARRVLADHLPVHELEALSEHSIEYWSGGEADTK
jgi:hypothetical protein